MEDSRIIELYFERNERAIAETDQKYGAMCRAISGRIVADKSDAEECVNDTYFHAWNSIPPQKPDSLCAFVGAVVRNLSLDRYRKNHAKKRAGTFVPFDELAECIPADSPADDFNTRCLSETVNVFLSGLSEEHRIYFMRRYWLGEPLADIAKRYGVSANSLAVTMHRLRARLKKALENARSEE
jgi:RNA polymerase sigma-70 factor (ECF subfamily)